MLLVPEKGTKFGLVVIIKALFRPAAVQGNSPWLQLCGLEGRWMDNWVLIPSQLWWSFFYIRAVDKLKCCVYPVSWTHVLKILWTFSSLLKHLKKLKKTKNIYTFIVSDACIVFDDTYYVCAYRWHFKDFYHAFMMIFRVLCGEWIEPLWQCMRASNELCMAVFLPALIIGNFIVSFTRYKLDHTC